MEESSVHLKPFKTSETGSRWRPPRSIKCWQRFIWSWTTENIVKRDGPGLLLTEGTAAAIGTIRTENPRIKFRTSLWKRVGLSLWRENIWRRKRESGELHHRSYDHTPADGLTSTMSRLVNPTQTGRIQVESGNVRSGNHRVPPVTRSPWSATDTRVRVQYQDRFRLVGVLVL